MTDHRRVSPSDVRELSEETREFYARHNDPESEVRPGIRGKRAVRRPPTLEEFITDFLTLYALNEHPDWRRAAGTLIKIVQAETAEPGSLFLPRLLDRE